MQCDPRPVVHARRQRRSLLAGLLASALLAGCGFALRGEHHYAFASVAVKPDAGSGVALGLRRALAGAVDVAAPDAPVDQVQAVLDVLDERRESVVVGVNASGEVRELQLRMRVKFSLRTPQGKALIAASEIVQSRDISFSESAVLAKEAEEAMLYRDMQADIVQQILRRLAAVKP